MGFLEGLYIPRPDVRRLKSEFPREYVARLLVEEYKCKNIVLESNSSGIVETSLKLADLDSNEVGKLLSDDDIVWHLERWPLKSLRATRIYPPENDPYNLHNLVLGSRKRFGILAETLRTNYHHITEADIGFLPHPTRDLLPIFCIRGKVHNHVIDGHHRTILAVWEGRSSIDCLTAYKQNQKF